MPDPHGRVQHGARRRPATAASTRTLLLSPAADGQETAPWAQGPGTSKSTGIQHGQHKLQPSLCRTRASERAPGARRPRSEAQDPKAQRPGARTLAGFRTRARTPHGAQVQAGLGHVRRWLLALSRSCSAPTPLGRLAADLRVLQMSRAPCARRSCPQTCQTTPGSTSVDTKTQRSYGDGPCSRPWALALCPDHRSTHRLGRTRAPS